MKLEGAYYKNKITQWRKMALGWSPQDDRALGWSPQDDRGKGSPENP